MSHIKTLNNMYLFIKSKPMFPGQLWITGLGNMDNPPFFLFFNKGYLDTPMVLPYLYIIAGLFPV